MLKFKAREIVEYANKKWGLNIDTSSVQSFLAEFSYWDEDKDKIYFPKTKSYEHLLWDYAGVNELLPHISFDCKIFEEIKNAFANEYDGLYMSEYDGADYETLDELKADDEYEDGDVMGFWMNINTYAEDFSLDAIQIIKKLCDIAKRTHTKIKFSLNDCSTNDFEVYIDENGNTTNNGKGISIAGNYQDFCLFDIIFALRKFVNSSFDDIDSIGCDFHLYDVDQWTIDKYTHNDNNDDD